MKTFLTEVREISQREYDPVELKKAIREAAEQGIQTVQMQLKKREVDWLRAEGFGLQVLDSRLTPQLYMVSWSPS